MYVSLFFLYIREVIATLFDLSYGFAENVAE